VSARAEALHRIDRALAEVGAIDACLAATRTAPCGLADREGVARRFHDVARAGDGHHAFAAVEELARLAGDTADDAEVAQHAADVLSLLLRDMGRQLLGCPAGDVAPAANALRERLEQRRTATHRCTC
jgi:hypothetical protein